MRLPIVQVAWGFSEDRYGLLFTSELKYEPQYFSFAIPLPIVDQFNDTYYSDVEFALKNNSFYFPGEVAKKYVEFEGEVAMPNDFDDLRGAKISFQASQGIKIDFVIDVYAVSLFYRKQGIRVREISRYVGQYKHPVFDRCVFAMLELSDVNGLNRFFLEEKGLFIGYTNTFGQFLQQADQ